LAVVVLTNLNSYTTARINTALAGTLHGEAVNFAPPPKEIAVPTEILARYVGTYEFSDGRVAFTLEGSHLIAHFGATFPLFAESETKFFSRGWDLQFDFSKNDKGEFAFVTEYEGGRNSGKAQKK